MYRSEINIPDASLIWKKYNPHINFAVKYFASFRVKRARTYKFKIEPENARLSVGSYQCVNSSLCSVNLDEGFHNVTIEYVDDMLQPKTIFYETRMDLGVRAVATSTNVSISFSCAKNINVGENISVTLPGFVGNFHGSTLKLQGKPFKTVPPRLLTDLECCANCDLYF